MKQGHVFSVALLSLLFGARTASADSADDDDGFVDATQTETPIATETEAVPTSSFTTSVLFVEPELGILYRSSSGISLGCDVGLEFPVTAHRANSANLPPPMDSAMKCAEKGPIPSVNLLRLGYVL